MNPQGPNKRKNLDNGPVTIIRSMYRVGLNLKRTVHTFVRVVRLGQTFPRRQIKTDKVVRVYEWTCTLPRGAKRQTPRYDSP